MDRVLSEYGVPYDPKMEIGSGDKISTRPVFQLMLVQIIDTTNREMYSKSINHRECL
ncbi:hypothetical protein FB379_12361 [Aeribacillus composti]|jgi:hypothetical protein|nr:hypothetical protein FB379_12361 [Aeribacillus composti]